MSGPGLEGFLQAIAATGERIDLLATTADTYLDTLLEVDGNTLRMRVTPNALRVRSRNPGLTLPPHPHNGAPSARGVLGTPTPRSVVRRS